MQPQMCTKCKKNIAVVFITKIENGVTLNEGYCLRCARGLGIPQIDQAVRQMGISEEDLDLLSDEMSNMFGQRDASDDADDDEIDSQTATFPLLNQLFGGSGNLPAQPPRPPKKEEPAEEGYQAAFPYRRSVGAFSCFHTMLTCRGIRGVLPMLLRERA